MRSLPSYVVGLRSYVPDAKTVADVATAAAESVDYATLHQTYEGKLTFYDEGCLSGFHLAWVCFKDAVRTTTRFNAKIESIDPVFITEETQAVHFNYVLEPEEMNRDGTRGNTDV